MIVEYENYPKALQTITTDALHYYADCLMSRRLKRSLTVCIEGHDGIIDGYAHALSSWQDDWISPREFEIIVNLQQDQMDLLRTLAHEMVHVKQWVRGELKERYRPRKVLKWQNRIIDRDAVIYWDLPWEVEAHGREDTLVAKYLCERCYETI